MPFHVSSTVQEAVVVVVSAEAVEWRIMARKTRIATKKLRQAMGIDARGRARGGFGLEAS